MMPGCCARCGSPRGDGGADQFREQRRTVSVLFVDMVGFTALSASLDPEDVRALQQRYFQAVSQVIGRWSGVVEKYVGDAVLAVFGAPRSNEDDAGRAVRAGLEIVAAATGVRRPDGSPVRVRVGIATGEAVVDLAAARDRGQAMVTGDVVNTAARLQGKAVAGTVLVTAATRRAAGSGLDFQRLPPLTVAGKPAPLEVWQAQGATRPDPGAGPPADPVPLVGRQAELTALVGAVTRVLHAGVPGLVSVVGPAGVGKSRLVREAAHRIRDRGGRAVRFWYAWCPPRAGGDPALLADLRRVLRAAGGPLVVVLEDVHHGDPALAGFLRELATAAAPGPRPVAVVTTGRPAPGASGPVPHAVVPVGPLDRPDSRRLLRHLLRRAGLPVVPGERLLGLVAGNPRFAEAYAEMLASRPARRGSHGAPGAGPGDLPVPEPVRRCVSAWLDHLAGADQAAVSAAAVCRDALWPGAVAALLGTGQAQARAAVGRLERLGLLVPKPRSRVTGQPEYTWRHAAVAQVAYVRLPRAVRIECHRRVAQWLGAPARSASSVVDELRAGHWLAAARLAAVTHRDAGSYRSAAGRALVSAAGTVYRRGVPGRAGMLAGQARRLWPAGAGPAGQARARQLAQARGPAAATSPRPASRRAGPLSHRHVDRRQDRTKIRVRGP